MSQLKSHTEWGTRAERVYDEAYARRYREHDEASRDGESIAFFSRWIGNVCDRFTGPIDVLDIGCGTGRYFHALRHVRRLVGIDVSQPMLDRARNPVGGLGGVSDVTLVAGDFLRHEFEPAAFDSAYSIGVLAEHSPFDEQVASRVRSWLRPLGRFAFTVVHPSSTSVPRTLKRRMGEWLAPIAPGPFADRLRARLLGGGLYADEPRLRSVLTNTGFTVESIEPFESDVHSHLLTVARNG